MALLAAAVLVIQGFALAACYLDGPTHSCSVPHMLRHGAGAQLVQMSGVSALPCAIVNDHAAITLLVPSRPALAP
eukprot:6176429-Pleurochrysis_carterae.AAC.2